MAAKKKAPKKKLLPRREPKLVTSLRAKVVAIDAGLDFPDQTKSIFLALACQQQGFYDAAESIIQEADLQKMRISKSIRKA